MAKYLDLDGLSAYDALIKEHISDAVSELGVNSQDITNLEENISSVDSKVNDLQSAIGNIASFDIVVTPTRPETGNAHTIYLVPSSATSENNAKDEYLYINGAWEKIGTTQLQLDISTFIHDDIDSPDPGAGVTDLVFNATRQQWDIIRTNDYFLRGGDIVESGEGDYISDICLNTNAAGTDFPVLTIYKSSTPAGVEPITSVEINALFS